MWKTEIKNFDNKLKAKKRIYVIELNIKGNRTIIEVLYEVSKHGNCAGNRASI